MRRRQFLRRASSKRLVLLGDRAEVVNEIREAAEFDQFGPTCRGAVVLPDLACSGPLDPHEPLSRGRGGSITDRGNIVLLCRRHHAWAHTHPIEAHRVGLLVHSWEKSGATSPTGRGGDERKS